MARSSTAPPVSRRGGPVTSRAAPAREGAAPCALPSRRASKSVPSPRVRSPTSRTIRKRGYQRQGRRARDAPTSCGAFHGSPAALNACGGPWWYRERRSRVPLAIEALVGGILRPVHAVSPQQPPARAGPKPVLSAPSGMRRSTEELWREWPTRGWSDVRNHRLCPGCESACFITRARHVAGRLLASIVSWRYLGRNSSWRSRMTRLPPRGVAGAGSSRACFGAMSGVARGRWCRPPGHPTRWMPA